MRGLVDSLVAYIQNSLQDEKAEDKVRLNCSTYVTLFVSQLDYFSGHVLSGQTLFPDLISHLI
jgi:hypothetical protein